MELLEIITENVYQIIASISIIVAILFGKNKTKEQIIKKKKKQLQRMEKQDKKDKTRLQNRLKKEQELSEEINNA